MKLACDIKNNNKFLIFIFFLSVTLRFIFFNFFVKDSSVLWQFDSRVYKQVAEKIIEKKQINNLDESPHFYRVPGYSIFLALTNFDSNFNNSLLIQIILSGFIPILIFYLSLILFPQNFLLAKLSALYSCIHLGFIIFSGLALTESIFLILFLSFLILYFKNNFFYAGILLGFASMFRPVGHYLFFLTIFLILFLTKNLKYKLTNILFIFSGWLIVILPWLLRNFLLTEYLFFSTLPGMHFIKHSAARIYMQVNNISYMNALNTINQEWVQSIKKYSQDNNKILNEAEICNIGEKIAFDYFIKYPFIALNLSVKNILKTCFSLYSSELLFLDSGGVLPDYSNNNNVFDLFKRFLIPKVNNKFIILFIYLEIIFFIFLILGFVGFIINSVYYSIDRKILVKLILFVYLFIFISLSCGFARLRLPIEPILIILSVKFWLYNFLKKRNYE